ncbi:MAG: hypothetical protein JWP87_2775, partial [Labilithrix sp.]|nr:hypothetical protein [Labilithrix sp.]
AIAAHLATIDGALAASGNPPMPDGGDDTLPDAAALTPQPEAGGSALQTPAPDASTFNDQDDGFGHDTGGCSASRPSPPASLLLFCAVALTLLASRRAARP